MFNDQVLQQTLQSVQALALSLALKLILFCHSSMYKFN